MKKKKKSSATNGEKLTTAEKLSEKQMSSIKGAARPRPPDLVIVNR